MEYLLPVPETDFSSRNKQTCLTFTAPPTNKYIDTSDHLIIPNVLG